MELVRDINFFTPYIEKEDNTTIKFVVVGATIMILGITGTMGYNKFQLDTLNEDINKLNITTTDPEFIEQYDLAYDVATEKELLDGYNHALETIYKGIEDRTIIDSSTLKKINSTVPVGIDLNKLLIENGNIIINGIAKNDKEIADFKYNLDKLPFVGESFIKSTNLNFSVDDGYTFVINCTLVEGK
ncbi:MAG: PilN domain-containing protein [Sarcina sp.]